LEIQFKETENKWDLLVREVVEAQLSPYWAHGWLEVPEIKWVLTNNYKFHTFRSVHCHPSLSPRLSFRFFRGSGSKTTFGCSNMVMVWDTHTSGWPRPGAQPGWSGGWSHSIRNCLHVAKPEEDQMIASM